MEKQKTPENILEILKLCKCPKCGQHLEFGLRSGDYEYVPLLDVPLFPNLKQGQNHTSSGWRLYCALDPYHDVSKVISINQMQELMAYVDQNLCV
jgi:hypothetical protein